MGVDEVSKLGVGNGFIRELTESGEVGTEFLECVSTEHVERVDNSVRRLVDNEGASGLNENDVTGTGENRVLRNGENGVPTKSANGAAFFWPDITEYMRKDGRSVHEKG